MAQAVREVDAGAGDVTTPTYRTVLGGVDLSKGVAYVTVYATRTTYRYVTQTRTVTNTYVIRRRVATELVRTYVFEQGNIRTTFVSRTPTRIVLEEKTEEFRPEQPSPQPVPVSPTQAY